MMWNFYWYDYLIIVVVFIIAIYFLVIRPRMKSKVILTPQKQLQEKIQAAKTSADFTAIYWEIKNEKDNYSVQFNDWCQGVTVRIKELTPVMPESAEIPKSPDENPFEALKDMYIFVTEVYKPLSPKEKRMLNTVTNEQLGLELLYIKGPFF